MRGLRSALTGLALLIGMAASALHAAVPSAGTLIHNQAEVTYFNSALGVVETVTSNTVLIEVGQYPALKVDFDQTVHVPADTVSQFGFLVTNTGNVPLEPVLTLNQASGDDFNLSEAAIVVDSNRNGVAEAGEPVLASGDTIMLPVGVTAGLIVTFRTPINAADLQKGIVSLAAKDASFPSAADSSTGTAILVSSTLTLEKQVNKSAVEAGEALRYTLRLRNESSKAVPAYDAIDGEPIIIDGAQVATPGGVLVRDEIPLNTKLSSIVESVNFTPLYHLSESAQHTYRTSAPDDLAQVDAVAWFYSGDYPGSSSADLVFEVSTLDNVAHSTVYNKASTWQHAAGRLLELESNTVATPVKGVEGALSFTDGTFNAIDTTPLNSNARVVISASACNQTTSVDAVEARISTSPEGDIETVAVTETGPNTGVFRSAPIPVQSQLPAVQENGVLSGNRSTEATARAICGGQTLSDTLIINPGGIVFNSLTNEAVPGAQVLIYDSSGVELARQVTDANGYYQFSNVTDAAAYTLVVVPPEGYAFPSSTTAFPGFGRNVDRQASYGKRFTTKGAFFGIDIPLDPSVPAAALVVSKEASRSTVGPGDFIVYTVTVENITDTPVSEVRLHDALPLGVALVEDSARLDGEPVTVAGGLGPDLDFDLGTISGNTELTLTYIVHVKPNARGKLVNSAYAEGSYYGASEPVQSPLARAMVRVEPDGVFDKSGTVLGTVFVDLNGNGIQDLPPSSDGMAPLPYDAVDRIDCGEGDDGNASAGCVFGEVVAEGQELTERGIPGVKIYFENGANVVTDELGRFSMPGLKAVTHVMAISRRSLPETLEPKFTTTRDALSPYSRFIDVKRGELRVENISLVPRPGATPDNVLAELKERDEDYGSLATPDNIFWSEDELNLPGERPTSNRANEATHQTATEIVVEQARARQKAQEETAAAADSDRSKEIERTVDLKTLIRGLSPELAFLDRESEDVLNDEVVTIRIKGPAKGTLELLANGEVVSPDHISQRTVYQRGNIQAVEYVAVKLKPGENDLLLTMTDPFGNVRERRELTVYAPGKPAKLKLIAPPGAIADPSSPIPVLVRVLDADGLPTYASMDVTLQTLGGSRWDVRDIRESEPGVQAYIDGGEAVFDYYPPSIVGTHRITVSNGLGTFETEIKLVADTSERLMAGVIEGAVRFGSDGGGATLLETDGLSPFEDTVEGVRGALYLKGKIRGDLLLTLRYDSDRDTEDRLFRDIDPDRYYPVYGDTSERGFDAQSDGRLYVKVEKGLNYILYGDLDIAAQASTFKLGRFSRSITGGQAHFEKGPVTVDLFAGMTDDEQVIREFRADGTSGPFELDLEGYVENSEIVEIVTRDRNQPSLIDRTVRLERYVDYRINYFDDTIIFNEPIPAFDDGFDPNFIRITYEVDRGGDDYWVYGGEVRYEINDRISVGYREVHSDADSIYESRQAVRAGYAAADMGKYGTLEIEGAQSIDQNDEEGYAGRIKYEVETKKGRLKVEAAKTDERFDPPGSSVSSGREEIKVEAEHKLMERMKARGEAIYSRDRVTDDERYGAEALVELQASKEIALYAGGRYVREKAGETSDIDDEVISAVFGARWKPARFPRLTVEGEIEEDLSDLSNMRFQGKASYNVSDRLRIYGEMEARTEGAAFYDLGSTSGDDVMLRAGVEYAWTDHLASFSEMRSGSRNGFANGLEADWEIGKTAGRVRASIEHFQPYDLSELIRLPFTPAADRDEEPVTTITLGYTREDEDKDTYLDLDAEASLQGGDYSLYGAQAFGRRHEGWTYMVQNRIAYAEKEGGDRWRDHLRFGNAWRPGGPFTALSLLGIEADFDDQSGIDTWDAYWSAAGEYDLGENLRVRGKQAGQYQATKLGGVDVDSLMLLAQGGVEYDIGKRFMIGVNGTAFYDAMDQNWYPGVGGEIGFVPAKNMLVSAGYNWTGVDDEVVDNVYASGFFLRLRAKFDEETWVLFEKWGLTPGNGR